MGVWPRTRKVSRAVLQCAPYSSVGSDEGRGVIRKSAENQDRTAQRGDWKDLPGR